MKVLDPGHRYALRSLDGGNDVVLQFVKRRIPGRSDTYPGTTCQEVLRALIDRVQSLNAEKPWHGNPEILKNLRTALVLFETRALEHKVAKGSLLPENIPVSQLDGHFRIHA